MPRQTAEERRAIARQERINRAIADFAERVARLRRQRVYDDKACFDATTTEPALISLYELVHDFRTTTKDLRRTIGYLQDRLTDVVRRLDVNEPTYSSAVVGGGGSDVDMLIAKRDAVREAVIRMAWTTGWYVPDVYDDRDRAKRDRLVSVNVVPDEAGTGSFFVKIGDGLLTRAVAHLTDGDPMSAVVFPNAQAGWLAAMVYCGEPLP